MNEQQNIDVISEIYAAFGRGDVAGILARCTDDVKWTTHLDPIVPWSGDYSGKTNVTQFFDNIFSSVEVTAFEPHEWIAQNDAVVSIGAFGCTARSTGKSVRTRWIFVWKFRGAEVCSYEQFHDEALAEAFRS